MRIAFRVDASVEMGTGHMRRCISLATAILSNGGTVAFVTTERAIAAVPPTFEHFTLPPTGALRDTAPGDPPHSAWLAKGVSDDAADTVAALADWKPDWVITDHYGIDARWHDAVRGALSCNMAAIDDLADRPHGVDLLIDHNWHRDHRSKYEHLLPNHCPILGGPAYAMLGQAYAAAPRYLFSPEVRSIGVFLGGTDHLDQTSAVLDCIKAAGFSGAIEIATTSSNPNLSKLQARVRADENLSLLEDAPDLAAFFARHDLQVGAGGGATWERFCIGAPSLLISFALNHDSVLLPLAEQNVAVVLPFGWSIDDLETAISQLIEDADRRQSLSVRCRELVDGQGGGRIVTALQREPALQINIRAATMDDAQIMFDWRNHPLVRSVSRDTDEIAFEDHEQWLAASMTRNDRTILLGETRAGAPIGVVRFDQLAQGEFEVSIYIDPARAGQGIGGRLLDLAERHFAQIFDSPIDILAVTMPGNTASERLFIKGGYRSSALGFRKTISS